MAVGSNSMLSTSNYEARKYGVRAGMPGFIGRQLCQSLVLVPPNFSKYKAVSKKVQEVFALYDPNYVMMSLDEGYLDITDYMFANSEVYSVFSRKSKCTDEINSTFTDSTVTSSEMSSISNTKNLSANGLNTGFDSCDVDIVSKSDSVSREKILTSSDAGGNYASNPETLAEVIVSEMRRKIEEATQLTASAGMFYS